MATSWGIDPLKDTNGNVTIGTTAADFRQIQGGLYTPGVISGGKVSRSASALTYTVSAGVAAFPIVTGSTPQTVLGPIPAGTLTTTAPSSGTRVDMVYAVQRTVAVEGDPNVVLDYGTSLPAKAVLLDAFIVSSGNTNSNAFVRQADIKYSIPYGASLGILYKHTATANYSFSGRGTDGSGSFYLPTDRLVRVSLTATLSAVNSSTGNAAVGFDNAAYCEAGYDLILDGVNSISWTSPGLSQAWGEYYWSALFTLSAGSHTIAYQRYRNKGPGYPYVHGDLSHGNDFVVEDIGPVA